jgi:hypothetical protein
MVPAFVLLAFFLWSLVQMFLTIPAELNYALYRTALLTSLVDIYKAMGGGWVTLADRMTAGGS